MEWSVLLCVVVWKRMGAKWGCVENKEEILCASLQCVRYYEDGFSACFRSYSASLRLWLGFTPNRNCHSSYWHFSYS